MNLRILVLIAIGLNVFSSLLSQTSFFDGPYKEDLNYLLTDKVQVRDMNNDGIDDIITTSYPGKVIWLERDTEFKIIEEHFILNADNWLHNGLIIEDINGDGLLDVCTIVDWSSFDYVVNIWFNQQNGAYFLKKTIPLKSAYPKHIRAADVDQDGDMDILTSDQDVDWGVEKLVWLENIGNNDFSLTPHIIQWNQDNLSDIQWVDMDGDGLEDILCTAEINDKITLFKNQGNGQFSDEIIVNNSLDAPRSVAGADLNGDGLNDVLVTWFNSEKVLWYENLGDLQFDGGTQIYSGVVYEAEVVDIDGDSDLDILCPDWSGSKCSILYNNGQGTFLESTIEEQILEPAFATSFNQDGDGDLDIILSAYDKLAIYEQTANGTFEPGFFLSEADRRIKEVVIEDISGDNLKDLILCSSQFNQIYYYPNNDDQSFETQKVLVQLDIDLYNFAAADIDEDGDLDFVLYAFNDRIIWAKNNGSNEFDELETLHVGLNVSSFRRGVILEDIDLDGNLDIIMWREDLLGWIKGLGQGEFSDMVTLATDIQISEVAVFNFDSQGMLDIAIASFYDELHLVQSSEPGIFSDTQIISEDVPNLRSILNVDLNNDGYDDLVFGSSHRIDVSINHEGDSLSQPVTQYSEGCHDFVKLDVNYDGLPDIITTAQDKLILYVNNGEGTLDLPIIIDATFDGFISALAIGDLTGDNIPDLACINTFNEEYNFYWHKLSYGVGCMDSLACNYDPESWIDSGQCCYEACGCTDSNAMNYNPLAECENNSCRYPIGGSVFFDEDEDGNFGDYELGLPYEVVHDWQNNAASITNDAGDYLMILPEGFYELTHQDNPVFPINTTPDPVVADSGTPSSYSNRFGLSNELPEYAICVDFYPSVNGYPCDTFVNHNVCFRNMGNLPLEGIVTVTFDELFQAYEEVTHIDSVSGNTVFMSFENLQPGEMFFYDIKLKTPTVDYIGEFLVSQSTVIGIHNGNQVAYGEKELELELTCAYDPNDKQVFPAGWSDEHYIKNDTTLEYLVRFQNTGNAPATDIHILDTLDQNLDWHSFHLMANSHSVITSIDYSNGAVDFFFKDIMLPDSVSNEPESHGLISYKIRPKAQLDLLTELNNTAYIFFDSNPPIITNTTYSVIYDCSLFEASFADNDLTFHAIEGDAFQWYLNGIAIENATDQIFSPSLNGRYSVWVKNGFPCEGFSPEIYIPAQSIVDTEGDFLIFPNPATITANIYLKTNQDANSLKILDNKGSTVMQFNLTNISFFFSVDLSALSSGQYFIQILYNDGSLSVQKLLVR